MVIYLVLGITVLFLIRRVLDIRNSKVKSITGKDALQVHAEGEATLIDVRTPAETSHGKIQGALEMNVTSMDFKNNIAKLDRSKPYIIYCRGGMRSTRACKIMEKEGFTDLTNVSEEYIGMKY